MIQKHQDSVAKNWYPSHPRFREEFEVEVMKAVKLSFENLDTSHISKILNRVPDVDLKRKMTVKLIAALPLLLNDDTKSLRFDKTRRKTFDINKLSRITLFPRIRQKLERELKLDGSLLTLREFVDEVCDLLTFRRRQLSDDDIETLSVTINRIIDSRTKVQKSDEQV